MLDNMNGLKRTHYCNKVNNNFIGQQVVVCGFVQKQRDKGNLIFVDLRDRTGIVQLTFNENTPKDSFEKAKSVRAEYVVLAKGEVVKRESINNEIQNGDIELMVNEFRILSKSETPPFHITDDSNVKEELRLKYRYLDLRTNKMQNTLMMRHKISKLARDYYDNNGFIEIETPILIKPTPEGARDYVVPSRVHQGYFFALPQSPQLYKQLLMLSGYDRYMQIARCFRDEDLRADRQPEFTQIDIEMSFVEQQDVMEINEGFMAYLFDKILNKKLQTPIKKITYDEAMNKYGSDKPDTRFGLELIDLSKELKNTEFKVFSSALETGTIKAINAKGLADKLTRKEIDKLVDFVKTYKAKGLAYTRITDESETSSYEKFLTEQEMQSIRQKLNLQVGDVALIIADANKDIVCNSLGELRLEVGKKFDLIDKQVYDLLWVTDFPLFEYDEENNRYVAKHHPFTAPLEKDLDKILSNPLECKAQSYDLVMNGCEIGGGSIRISNPDTQEKMFKAIGFTQQEAQEKFGFLIEAFKYGAPPHGGMAYGLDRLVMELLGLESIKDVIAFPKVQNSSELMTQCPAIIDDRQLKELNIDIL